MERALMKSAALPKVVVWDMTYACPLRCTYCYSESGRRASRQLSREDLLHVADVLVRAKPVGVSLSGGEPLIVKGIFEIAERLALGGILLSLYTSGQGLTEAMIPEMLRLFARVSVSLDGAAPETHDRLRGVGGSFDQASRALSMLDEGARRSRSQGQKTAELGIECTVTQSNLRELDAICARVAPRFPAMSFLSFSACIPTGLASREGFAERELLLPDDWRRMADPAFAARLQALAPEGCSVTVSDGRALRMSPEDVQSGRAADGILQLEPDGAARAIAMYEGTVGNLLEEPLEAIWGRVPARIDHPVLTEALASARTMVDWAAATRRIDRHFAAPKELLRISKRPAYEPAGTAA